MSPPASLIRHLPDRPGAPRSRRPRRLLVVGLMVGLAGGLLAGCGGDGRSASLAYRLVIEPCVGPVDGRSSAAAVGPDLLATAAHGLEQARDIAITDAAGQAVAGTVVHLDLDKDIALVRTAEPLPGHLVLTQPTDDEIGDSVGLATYAEAEAPVTKEGRILELVDVTLDGEGRRAAIRLEGDIEPGDSGSAVLDGDGRMVGMVFASARDRDSGWAVAASEIEAAIDQVERHRPGSALPTC